MKVLKDDIIYKFIFQAVIIKHINSFPTTLSSSIWTTAFDVNAADTSYDGILPTTASLFSDVNVDDNNIVETSHMTTTIVDSAYVPSKPQNLTVLDVTATTIKLKWFEPESLNGAIVGYRLFYIYNNQTEYKPINHIDGQKGPIIYTLSELKPYTEYKIFVQGFTWKNEGDQSDRIVQRTDIIGPTAPIVVNLTCISDDALHLRWKRPVEYYNSIDFYIIRFNNSEQDFQEIKFNASNEHLETAMTLRNLTTDTVYEIKVRAASISTIYPTQIILGKSSEPKRIRMQPNCEKIQSQLRQSQNDMSLAIIVAIVLGCFGLTLILMALLVWRKCFHAAYYYLDDPPCQGPTTILVDWSAPVEVGGEVRAAIPVNEFGKHVSSLHADGDIGFSKEYETIQNELINDDFPSEHSQHPENKGKNRYLNIIAYDHSRVHLRPTPGQKKTHDYINANFIDGYLKSRSFIGTQGPLPGTFDCFWRMIWEQRVSIIVMITNLVERGRRKCDMYWPKDGVECYGVIQVKFLQEEVMSTYTVRTFQIKHLKLKKKKQTVNEKLVYQYHYTNWPDHGTPDHPLPVLNFVKKSSDANPHDGGPIVVHCSAGVGRTGTYIVLDAMLKQIEHKNIVNVFGFLRHIRAQRNFLVQTEEQYIFIHDALVEAISSGETNIKTNSILVLKDDLAFLELQFKLITQFEPKDVHLISATKSVNLLKNRSHIVPLEESRVHLTPKPGEDGSEYINATWLPGFRRLRDFIVTQHPLTGTIVDFWQMIWDHNCQTIVLLSTIDEMTYTQFWPDESHSIESDYFRVKFLTKTTKYDWIICDFVIQSIQDDYELNVRMLYNPNWPEMNDSIRIYDFIVEVHQRTSEYRNGPIVVIDRFGGGKACVFCAITAQSMQMEYDRTVNIYTCAKIYHNRRPGIWNSMDNLRQIYHILSCLPSDLHLLKCTEIRTELDDITTVTPDLYSKICSNGNISSSLNNNTSTIATTTKNGGAVVVKMNTEDNDDFSVVVTESSNNINV